MSAVLAGPRYAPTVVPLRCTAPHPGRPGQCGEERSAHVHLPTPCRNGKDEAHHEFAPPPAVTIEIEGKRRRVKVPA